MLDVKARLERDHRPPDPLPVLQQYEPFEYSAQNLRDPFSPSLEEDQQQTPEQAAVRRPDHDRRKEPLEAFPLDSLTMVGTLGSGPGMVGLIVDPDHVVHRVRVGEYMGQNDGKIAAIYEDRIELMELTPNSAGGWSESSARVALDEKKG